MNDLIAWLNGKKTYITAIAGIGATLLLKYGYITYNQFTDASMVFAFLIAIFIRMAVKELAPNAQIEIPTPTKEDLPVAPEQPQIDPGIILDALKELLAEKKK